MEWSDIVWNVFQLVFDLVNTIILILCVYIIKDNKKSRQKGCIKNEIIKLQIKRQTANKKDKIKLDEKISQLENKLRDLEELI